MHSSIPFKSPRGVFVERHSENYLAHSPPASGCMWTIRVARVTERSWGSQLASIQILSLVFFLLIRFMPFLPLLQTFQASVIGTFQARRPTAPVWGASPPWLLQGLLSPGFRTQLGPVWSEAALAPPRNLGTRRLCFTLEYTQFRAPGIYQA